MKKIKNVKKLLVICVIALLSISLVTSIGINIYQLNFNVFSTYLQNTDEIYVMESGILYEYLDFADGEDYEISYDFENEDYSVLIDKYKIKTIAGDGSEFEKAVSLMNEYAPRLTHKSDYDNHIDINALSLLDYSLDNPEQGINCKNKAQILNEMCLALGIYSRKVWIMPNSKYDSDCHVVNEIWDTQLNKWIMLDITNNRYWVDENGTPLSILEIRYKGAMQEFCTPVFPNSKLDNLKELKDSSIANFLYIMKNMVYFEYMTEYTVGESENSYLLLPENFNEDFENMISKKAIEASPI